MLLRLSEKTDSGFQDLYVNDEHIVLLREDVTVFDGTKIYLIFLSNGSSRRIAKESYESVLSVIGWFDPRKIDEQKEIVAQNLDLVTPSKEKKARKEKP